MSGLSSWWSGLSDTARQITTLGTALAVGAAATGLGGQLATLPGRMDEVERTVSGLVRDGDKAKEERGEIMTLLKQTRCLQIADRLQQPIEPCLSITE